MSGKAYKEALVRGRYPYPQVLDEIISDSMVAGQTELGVMEIPIDQIVGTKTAGLRLRKGLHKFVVGRHRRVLRPDRDHADDVSGDGGRAIAPQDADPLVSSWEAGSCPSPWRTPCWCG